MLIFSSFLSMDLEMPFPAGCQMTRADLSTTLVLIVFHWCPSSNFLMVLPLLYTSVSSFSLHLAFAELHHICKGLPNNEIEFFKFIESNFFVFHIALSCFSFQTLDKNTTNFFLFQHAQLIQNSSFIHSISYPLKHLLCTYIRDLFIYLFIFNFLVNSEICIFCAKSRGFCDNKFSLKKQEQ